MDTSAGDTPTTGTRRWISADQWLTDAEDARDFHMRPTARPVHPARDADCYALNPPILGGYTSQRGYRTPPRRLRRADAEQAGRDEAAARINRTSDARLAGGDS